MEIRKVANFRRESYSRVGSVVVIEAVLLAMCWQLKKLGHENAEALTPEDLVQAYTQHAPPVAPPSSAAAGDDSNSDIATQPRAVEPTSTIYVQPAFEALPFYPRLGFQLQNPEKIILAEPNHPARYAWEVKDLEQINSFAEHLEAPTEAEFLQLVGGEAMADLMEEEVSEDDDQLYELKALYKYGIDLKEHAPKQGLSWPNFGVKNRFRNGEGTSNDLELVELMCRIHDWNYGCYLGGPMYIRERVEQFARENPDCDNWLDAKPYRMPARVVLQREQQRLRERGPRVGMSGAHTGLSPDFDYTMVLDAKAFLVAMNGMLRPGI
jgi:hypothetical protein